MSSEHIIIAALLAGLITLLWQNRAEHAQVRELKQERDDAERRLEHQYDDATDARATIALLRAEVAEADDVTFETALALANEQRLHERDVEWLHAELPASAPVTPIKKARPKKAAVKTS